MIQHGDADTIIPRQQSVRFAGVIAAIAGMEHLESDIIKGMGHHCDMRYETDENISRVFGFFDKYLK